MVSLEPDTFGRYISLDFGIVGTLTEFDKEYLAQNFLAFFRRDYKRVAAFAWKVAGVPRHDTRRGAGSSHPRRLRNLISTGRWLEISLGMVLMRLFQTLAPFPGRDPAPAGAAAKDAAQY